LPSRPAAASFRLTRYFILQLAESQLAESHLTPTLF